MATRDDRLAVSEANATTDGIGDPDHRVADLVQAARRLRGGAVGDVLAVDVLLAPPFAVVVAVKAEVETGAELDAGLVEHLDDEVAGHAVPGCRVDDTALEPTVRRVVAQLRREIEPRLEAAVGVLDATHHDLVHDAETGRGDDLEVDEHAVARAVFTLEEQRAPHHLEAEAG